jgi:hypothetical protein
MELSKTDRSFEIYSSYKFRQASNFWYLTGFEEPDSMLILGMFHPFTKSEP